MLVEITKLFVKKELLEFVVCYFMVSLVKNRKSSNKLKFTDHLGTHYPPLSL